MDTMITPDPDIAGIGVILAFIIVNGILMALVCIAISRNEHDGFELRHLILPERIVFGTSKADAHPTQEDIRDYVRQTQDDQQD